MRFAIIKNGVVENVIEADQNFVDKNVIADQKLLLKPTDTVGPGHTYDGKDFIPPVNLPAPKLDITDQVALMQAKLDALNANMLAVDTQLNIPPPAKS